MGSEVIHRGIISSNGVWNSGFWIQNTNIFWKDLGLHWTPTMLSSHRCIVHLLCVLEFFHDFCYLNSYVFEVLSWRRRSSHGGTLVNKGKNLRAVVQVQNDIRYYLFMTSGMFRTGGECMSQRIARMRRSSKEFPIAARAPQRWMHLDCPSYGYEPHTKFVERSDAIAYDSVKNHSRALSYGRVAINNALMSLLWQAGVHQTRLHVLCCSAMSSVLVNRFRNLEEEKHLLQHGKLLF